MGKRAQQKVAKRRRSYVASDLFGLAAIKAGPGRARGARAGEALPDWLLGRTGSPHRPRESLFPVTPPGAGRGGKKIARTGMRRAALGLGRGERRGLGTDMGRGLGDGGGDRAGSRVGSRTEPRAVGGGSGRGET